ncbi:MAG: hypothetical protein EXR93_06825 [Gemmatimonadetes bacterium]|nr:hypothetical protein [Gemmatimonadota bacterium]
MHDEYDAPPIAPTPAPAPGRTFPWRTGNLVAAGLVLFLAGVAAQTFRQPAAAAASYTGPRYALLLYEPPQSPDREPEQDIRELRDWLSSLRQQGHYVSAEHLAMGALEVERDTTWIAWLPGQSYGPPMLSGLLIISAADEKEITAIAHSSPHVRNGGRVIVRPVEEIQ